jgi:CHAT domain-containing protein
LQVFQARTLEERMHGAGLSGRAMAARVSADSLRRGVLRPGECLLDLVATTDTTFAFVVTRGGVTVRTLPGTARLDPLYRDWRDAMLAGAASPVVDGGLARLSQELLGPLAAPLRDSRRIIVSGGGPLALWPVAALTLPGETTPLGERREVAGVPSASLFAALRARGEASSPAPRLLALSRTTDALGRDLPGATRELTQLGHDYERVTVRENRGDLSVSQLTVDLAGFDALHFAAHAEAVEGTPWRSGFLLGRGTGDEAYLRASSVARLKLKARLAVLSGCQSAGATALAGEGALGLSSGFLSAGTRTVVATLWPVGDRAAARYMAAFYAGLASGRTVAAAAREARTALRGQADTANPRTWAAFVVLGEPGTTFPLKRRGRA